MAVKIRLSRHGKKNFAFYHIVVTDIRAPRDGRFIEQIGSYNPNSNPATIVIKSDRALYWLTKGAQPSPTARRILSYEGIMLRKHLQGGVDKGVFPQEEADKRWNEWKTQRDAKVASKVQSITSAVDQAKKTAIGAEAKVNEERAEAIAKRKAEEEAKKAEEAAAAAKAAEEAAAAAAADLAAKEEAAKAEAAPEAPKAEAEQKPEA